MTMLIILLTSTTLRGSSMAYVRKSVTSLRTGWSVVRGDLFFPYSALSIATMYVFTVNYPSISSIADSSLEAYLLTSLTVWTMMSLLLGAFINKKLKLKGHLVWNLVGIIFGITLFFPVGGFAGLLLYSILGGVSTGLFIPNILSSAINRTNFENRGSVSGLLVMLTYTLIIVCSLLIYTLVGMGIFFIIIKSIGIALARKTNFNLSSSETSFMKVEAKVKLSFGAIWFIFLMADALVFNIASMLISDYNLAVSRIATMTIGLASMLVGGTAMDNMGRKNLLVFSLSYLGLEYAAISLSGGALINYTFLDGFAWGILTVFFMMVLGGDIFSPSERPFYFAVVSVLALFGSYMRQTLFMIRSDLQIIQIFPLASVFLFIAVVIMLALPETLPEKIRQKKKLQDYLVRAKKVKERYR